MEVPSPVALDLTLLGYTTWVRHTKAYLRQPCYPGMVTGLTVTGLTKKVIGGHY